MGYQVARRGSIGRTEVIKVYAGPNRKIVAVGDRRGDNGVPRERRQGIDVHCAPLRQMTNSTIAQRDQQALCDRTPWSVVAQQHGNSFP